MKYTYLSIKDSEVVKMFNSICSDIADMPQLDCNLLTDLRLKLECIEYGSTNAEFAISYRRMIGNYSWIAKKLLGVNSETIISLLLRHAFRVMSGTEIATVVEDNSLTDIVTRNFNLEVENLSIV